MPRYKCKVDIVYPFTFEINANTEEELHPKLLELAYDLSNAEDRILEIAEITELPEVAALFTLPVLPDYTSDRMKEAFKVMVEEIQLAAGQSIIDDSLNQEYSDDPTSLTGDFMNHGSKEKIRKQSDTTKINQEQYDVIKQRYDLYKRGLLLTVNSSVKLTEYLNELLGLNKSRSVYSKIWCGEVDRKTLPKGE